MPYSAKTNWGNNDIVYPEDLNRIENGIVNSAEKNLSNVGNVDFKTKARANLIPISSSVELEIFVSRSGRDDYGDGTAENPFLSINRALRALPEANEYNVMHKIYVAAGDYPGFTFNCNKNVTVILQGNVVFTSNIFIDHGAIAFTSVGSSTPSLTFRACHLFARGGKIQCSVPVTFADYSIPRNAAIECSNGAIVNMSALVTITHAKTGVVCTNSTFRALQITASGLTTGVSCTCGIVQIGEETISATTKFVIQLGGRVFVGSQSDAAI